MTDFELIDTFKTLVRRAMSYAQHAHDFIFDENVDNAVALSYLNVSASKFAAAESLYYARYKILQRGEAEELFRLFDVFMSELLTNVRTDHSHQWTDIEFNNLKDVFDSSAFAYENH